MKMMWRSNMVARALLFTVIFTFCEFAMAQTGWTNSSTYKLAGQTVVFNIVKPPISKATNNWGWYNSNLKLYCQGISRQTSLHQYCTIDFEKSCNNNSYSAKWTRPDSTTEGTLSSYTAPTPTYTPPATCSSKVTGQARIELYKGALQLKYYQKRDIYIYKDILQMDMENFGSSGICATVSLAHPSHTSVACDPWSVNIPVTGHNSNIPELNCFTIAKHVFTGQYQYWVTGSGSQNYFPITINNSLDVSTLTQAMINNITNTLCRGDVILFVSASTANPVPSTYTIEHANIVVTTKSAKTWGANNKAGLQSAVTYKCDTDQATHELNYIAYWSWGECNWNDYITKYNKPGRKIVRIAIFHQ